MFTSNSSASTEPKRTCETLFHATARLDSDYDLISPNRPTSLYIQLNSQQME